MKKRLLILIVTLTAVLQTAWAYDFGIGDLGYSIIGPNTVEVSYCNYDAYSVTIPATVTDLETGITYSVTSIGIHAFSSRQLVSVTIPNSVTTIDSSAFEGCSNLISVTIGNSVTSIGRWAFASCTNLTSITIPNSVTSIEYAAFSWCSNLTTVTIPNSVTYIGSYAFNECSDLTSVTIPNSVTFIEEGVFSKCSSLTSVNIPNSVTSIGRTAFHSTGLTSVTLPNSVDTIGDYAFSNSALTSITIPENVRHVGIRAFGIDGYDIQSSLTTVVWNAKNVSNFYSDYNAPFSGCNNISTVTFGDSVRVIPDYLFTNCTGLTSVTLSNSVDTIGREAFYNTGLTSITIPENVKYIGNDAFGVDQYDESGNIIQSSLTTVVWNAKNVSNFYSGYNAPFRSCNNISTVTFGDSVKVIPNYIFNDCSSLTSVNIGNNVSTVGDYAFNDCTGLTSVTLPNSVDTIGREAFYNTGLTSITIPENVKYVGNNAFGADQYGNIQIRSSLTTVVWNAKNAIRTGTGSSDWHASPFSGCRNISTVTFGDSVKVIDCAFFPSVREGITPNVHYGRDIESWINIERPIENTAGFSDYYGMFSGSQYNLYINNQLVTNLVIPNTIDTIQKYTFRDCSSIQSVTIPTQIKFIGRHAFYGNINSITWNAINCDLEGQIFGDYYAFNTTSLVLGDSVQVIPDEAFVALGITNVNLPNSLTSIGEQAFLGCTNLASITIPSQVTTIGNYAFAECGNLRSITMEPTVPPTIYSQTFDEVGTGVRVNVPCGTVEDYSSAAFWFNFSNIQQSNECVRTITAMSLNTSQGSVLGGGTYEYGSTATIAAIPQTGYQFYQWNDGDITNPRSLVVSSDSSFIATFSAITTGGGVVHDTLYVDRYIYDTITNTVYDTITNTVYDTVTNTIYDTIDNFIYDTVYITETDTLWLFDTIYLHDTIYIYDTIYIRDSTTGIEDVSVINAKIYSSRSRIIVEGADGNSVMLFDMQGRLLSTKRDKYSVLEFEVPISGAYFVKIGNYKAKKVVVIK